MVEPTIRFLRSEYFFGLPRLEPLQYFRMKLLINGEERSFGDNMMLAALVDELGLKADRIAIELNQSIVRRDHWPSTMLHDGDRLEVVHFVGGGLAG